MGHGTIIARDRTGTVKWFNAKKGYGFIEPHDGGPDIFVHRTDVEHARRSTLTWGVDIGFDLRKNGRKVSAVNLRL
ncbi:hypothetical protein A2851_02680 [Candidatus Kaiserbacteria bacterium RIFCSPHIGHO2_01_FULL_53_29]|uniref:CSD domain-containing protein n=1 Tax=Candidatus Kaiserbacteria bacterium RIFCSPHIGHO2_01_FULL_53_29 TaxID=1798480 RepID=A0A1F6CX76_9BACT|nr:MAG: hypothetical protein A2851_02680 [Candidatus Kaiserbacteria bacterium RIFCSPHIGHO2_01_FULL_53_29]